MNKIIAYNIQKKFWDWIDALGSDTWPCKAQKNRTYKYKKTLRKLKYNWNEEKANYILKDIVSRINIKYEKE